MRAVLDGDDDKDEELDTDGQFEWLEVTVIEPLPEGEPDRDELGDSEAVTETDPESEPLCVDVALTDVQPDGDADRVVVPLAVLVCGSLLGDAVPLCATDADTVETYESDDCALEEGESDEMIDIVDNGDSEGCPLADGFEGVGNCVVEPENVPELVDEMEAELEKDWSLVIVAETEVDPDTEGPFENDAETDGDCELIFCVAEFTTDGETEAETETEPVNDPEDEGELDTETDIVNVTDTVNVVDESDDADCAAVPVAIVAVAHDADAETLGLADAELKPESDGTTDCDGVPERHWVTVAENESIEADGCGDVDIAADGVVDEDKQRLAVEDTVDERDCVSDTVADPEKVVPQYAVLKLTIWLQPPPAENELIQYGTSGVSTGVRHQ